MKNNRKRNGASDYRDQLPKNNSAGTGRPVAEPTTRSAWHEAGTGHVKRKNN